MRPAMRWMVSCALVLALAACTPPYYVHPDRGPIAKLRVQPTGPGQSVLVTAWASDQCTHGGGSGTMGVAGGIRTDPLNRVPPEIKTAGNTERMIGYDPSAPIQPIERTIPAEKEFVFSIFRVIPGAGVVTTCNLSMAFLPRDGAEYEVQFSESARQCFGRIYRLVQGPGGAVSREREPTQRMTQKNCGR